MTKDRKLPWSWILVSLALGLVAVYARRNPSPPLSESRFLMDTIITVSIWGENEEKSNKGFAAAFNALEEVDKSMARIPGSTLQELNLSGSGKLSPGMAEVLDSALFWAQKSRGAFDPTVAPLLDAWGVSSGPRPPPSKQTVAEALAKTGWEKVRWDKNANSLDLKGAALDFGGIAKGYSLDKAATALKKMGLFNFLINAGGDIYINGSKGKRPWIIAIQHPRDEASFLRTVSPKEGSLVTSGDYERYYEWEGKRIHHIIDPRTGYPARAFQSVSIWAKTAMKADALATAVFALGKEEGLKFLESEPDAEGLLVADDGKIIETAGFKTMAPESVL